jgi:hypothetical protein
MPRDLKSLGAAANKIGAIALLGAAIGTAVGAALGNVALGVAGGAVLGLVIGIVMEFLGRSGRAPGPRN